MVLRDRVSERKGKMLQYLHGTNNRKMSFVSVPDDVALLERHNPIPWSEHNETVDNCIFSGWLKNESSAHVAMSGGCPYNDTFEVSQE